MTHDPGVRLGAYEVLAPLGHGGMGEVYRAVDTKLKRQVALKVLPADVVADPERVARLQREAEVLASLNHPHIAQIYGVVDGGSAGADAARNPPYWLWSDHYPTEEAFLFAIADAMHEGYTAITNAGILLQIDDPSAGCYSFEAANGRHEHEWVVWEDVTLPDGKTLMPGVVSHVSDVVEHPERVKQLGRFTRPVGRDRVMAGTDCGLGSRVGHGEIAWAKLDALVEGARLASASH